MDINNPFADLDGDETIGPATDLVVSVLAVLLLILFITRTSYIDVIGGKYDFSFVSENQNEIIERLNQVFQSERLKAEANSDELILSLPNKSEIRITTKATVQRLSFGNGILFGRNDATLSRQGKIFLDKFTIALRPQLHNLTEIKIEGHADTRGASDYNLELAGQRARSVFEFIQSKGVDPVENLISAATFGYYSPTSRTPGKTFNNRQLNDANSDAERRSQNRRIEVVLVYKLAP